MRTRWNFQAIGSGTVLVAAALAALIVLLALGYATGWDATWRGVGVTPLKPHFFDMHAVTDQAACSAQGYNAYEVNSCAPLKFNYPPIWLQLGYLGINGLDSAWLSILVAFIAFVVVATLLKGRSAFDGVISFAAILSPSVMMGVERGNIDLVVFALVGSAALAFKDTKFSRAFGASLIVLVAVLLKLYPVFCVALLAKFNKRTLFFAITLIIGSLIYFYSIFDYLPTIRANTPISFMLSYGYKVIFLGLDHLRAEAGREALRLADTWLPIALVFIVLALGIAAAAYFAFNREPFCTVTNGTPGTAFLFGSGIYCGTYLLETNFIYRLMFLLLCIPQIQDWTKSNTENNNLTVTISYVLQVFVLLTLWSNGNSNGHSTFVVTAQLLNWAIFFGFVSILALTCISSIRRT